MSFFSGKKSPIRKIEGEIPVELEFLRKPKPAQIVLGDNLYELSPLSYADFGKFGIIISDVMIEVLNKLGTRKESFASDREFFSFVRDVIVESRALDTLTNAVLSDVAKDDFEMADVTQITYAAKVFYEINFSRLPEDLRKMVMAAISSFGSSLIPSPSDPSESRSAESQ